MVVIQHEPGEGAGTLAPFLGSPRVVRVFAGDPIPLEADALVVLGGGMSAYDTLPFLSQEIALLRRCVELGRPVLGICLGCQLLAAALGGTVARAPRKEIGFHRVRCAPELFGTSSFVAFHWHGDAFTLPPGAVPLASSELTPLQAFRLGERVLGLQFHLEVDALVLEAMVASGAEQLAEMAVDGRSLLAESRRELPPLAAIAERVFSRWSQS